MLSVTNDNGNGDKRSRHWRSLLAGSLIGLALVVGAGFYFLFAKANTGTIPPVTAPSDSTAAITPNQAASSDSLSDRCKYLRAHDRDIDLGMHSEVNGDRLDDENHPRGPIPNVTFGKGPQDYLDLVKCDRDVNAKPEVSLSNENTFLHGVHTGMTMREVADAMPINHDDSVDPFSQGWHYTRCAEVPRPRTNVRLICVLSRMNGYNLPGIKTNIAELDFDGTSPDAKLLDWSVTYSVPNPYTGRKEESIDDGVRDARSDNLIFVDLDSPNATTRNATHSSAGWMFHDRDGKLTETVDLIVKKEPGAFTVNISVHDNDLDPTTSIKSTVAPAPN